MMQSCATFAMYGAPEDQTLPKKRGTTPISAAPCSKYESSKNSDMYCPAFPTNEDISSKPVITTPKVAPMLGRVPSSHFCHGFVSSLMPAATSNTNKYCVLVMASAMNKPRGTVLSIGSSHSAEHVETQSQPSKFQNKTLIIFPKHIAFPGCTCVHTEVSTLGSPRAMKVTTGAPVVIAIATSMCGTLEMETKVGRLNKSVVNRRHSHFCSNPISVMPITCITVSQIRTGYTAASATPLTNCQYVTWKPQKSPKASRIQIKYPPLLGNAQLNSEVTNT
mmetsp:Transcript_25859/g.73922  ORF Transcript_25859/g.73922 Transcript_25859/m.73922 type:complete len:278 (+) Transcript_25859:378-1211(+)